MIIYATTIHKPALKSLWKTCFEDSNEFIEFYFDCIYQDENSLIFLDENNIPIAFLQIIPYQLKLGTKIYDAGYISGAMTHPKHRKKGYMQQLLEVTFVHMKKLNYAFTFLIPEENWLFDFYAKYGYTKAFPKSINTIDLKLTDKLIYQDVNVYQDINNIPIKAIYSLYTQLQNRKINIVTKTQMQFKYILQDLFISKGCIFYLKDKGIAFVVLEKNNLLIKELLYTEENVKLSLLNAIKATFNLDKAIILNEPVEKNMHFYGMIKILNPFVFQETLPVDIYMNMMLD